MVNPERLQIPSYVRINAVIEKVIQEHKAKTPASDLQGQWSNVVPLTCVWRACGNVLLGPTPNIPTCLYFNNSDSDVLRLFEKALRIHELRSHSLHTASHLVTGQGHKGSESHLTLFVCSFFICWQISWHLPSRWHLYQLLSSFLARFRVSKRSFPNNTKSQPPLCYKQLTIQARNRKMPWRRWLNF